jgi:hypothetical protein
VIIGTKLDLEGSHDNLKKLQKKFSKLKVVGLSNYTKEGLQSVKEAFIKMMQHDNEIVETSDFVTTIDLDAVYRDEQ